MRAIFVNHCHPDCPHVCGTRAREFANALARQGHRIVLLTETLHPDDAAMEPERLPMALVAHDWRQPFRLACAPRRSSVLSALRAGRLPAVVSKATVLCQYLARGGMFTDWRDGSRIYWEILARVFEPEVVWGIFGNTDAWAIAQGIARVAGCPWVRDLKDQWTRFIPALVRAPLSGRFADAATATALSQADATDAQPWFPGPATVVYSGFSQLAATGATVPGAPFTLAVVGAVYEPGALAALVQGIKRFCESGNRNAVRVMYAGTDTGLATEALRPLQHRAEIEIRQQLPFAEYWQLISRADANLYVRVAERGWWHHKLIEFLAARRPIVCCPGEIDEARQLASRVGGRLYDCPDAAAVASALEDVWRERPASSELGDPARLAELTWDAQARILVDALRGGRPKK